MSPMSFDYGPRRLEELSFNDHKVPVSIKVKRDYLDELVNGYGFTVSAASRGLYLGDGDLGSAVQWMEKHQEEKDFNLPLMVEDQKEEIPDLETKKKNEEKEKEEKRKLKEMQDLVKKKLDEDAKKIDTETTVELVEGSRIRTKLKDNMDDYLLIRESGQWKNWEEGIKEKKQKIKKHLEQYVLIT